MIRGFIELSSLSRNTMMGFKGGCKPAGHGMHGGPPNEQGNNSKVPPAWSPEWESQYPLWVWAQDLNIWTMATELPPARQGPAVVMQLGGTAKIMCREMDTQELQHGVNEADVVNGGFRSRHRRGACFQIAYSALWRTGRRKRRAHDSTALHLQSRARGEHRPDINEVRSCTTPTDGITRLCDGSNGICMDASYVSTDATNDVDYITCNTTRTATDR